MFAYLISFVLSYLSLVALMMGAVGGYSVRIVPALVTVFVVRWMQPVPAAVWAFLLGLACDAVDQGPMGGHAGALVLVTAVLSRCGVSNQPVTPVRWMLAIVLACLLEVLVPWGIEAISAQGEISLPGDWPALLISAGICAAGMGLCGGVWQRITGAACTTR